MKERLEERLRRLNIGSPDPALRERVLGAAGAVLTEIEDQPAGQGWLAGWRVEAMLGAGIAVAAVILLVLNPSKAEHSVPVARIDQAMVDSIVEELQLDQDLEDHFRSRLQLSEEKLAAMRRAGHDARTYEIEAF